MASKCERVDGAINTCLALRNCLDNGIGGFSLVVRVNMETMKEYVVLTSGSSKKNRVGLNYCPACGAHIEAVEEDHD